MCVCVVCVFMGGVHTVRVWGGVHAVCVACAR